MATCTYSASRTESGDRTIVIPMLVYEVYALCRKGDIYTVKKFRVSTSAFGFNAGSQNGVTFSRVSGASPVSLHSSNRLLVNTRASVSRAANATATHSASGDCNGLPSTLSVTVSANELRSLISVASPVIAPPACNNPQWTQVVQQQLLTMSKAAVMRPNAYLEITSLMHKVRSR